MPLLLFFWIVSLGWKNWCGYMWIEELGDEDCVEGWEGERLIWRIRTQGLGLWMRRGRLWESRLGFSTTRRWCIMLCAKERNLRAWERKSNQIFLISHGKSCHLLCILSISRSQSPIWLMWSPHAKHGRGLIWLQTLHTGEQIGSRALYFSYINIWKTCKAFISST